jgi:deazaflavin-dependent oxidoreductase (nitroreductase family)
MWYNPIILFTLKSSLHWLLSNQMMVVAYTGRKSGKTYQVPVSYVEIDYDPNEHLLLVISKLNRTWWRNLLGGADVNVRLRGRTRSAHAEAFTGDDALPDLTQYATYSHDVAKSLGVGFNPDNRPFPDDIKKLSKGWLIVRFKL